MNGAVKIVVSKTFRSMWTDVSMKTDELKQIVDKKLDDQSPIIQAHHNPISDCNSQPPAIQLPND